MPVADRPKYAANTKIDESKSREEIDKLLKKYGATKRTYGFDDDRNLARIQFALHDRMLRFDLPMPSIHDFTMMRAGARGTVARSEAQAVSAWEQACRQKWRALALVVKAKLEAVESEIVSFEQEFLAHIVLPNGQTVGEWTGPQIEQIYISGAMPQNLPGLPPPSDQKKLTSEGDRYIGKTLDEIE